MKGFSRKITVFFAGILTFSFICGCKGYEPDYTYTPIDPGELPAPTVERTDPTFREYYPTLEPYEEPVTITVAAVQYG